MLAALVIKVVPERPLPLAAAARFPNVNAASNVYSLPPSFSLCERTREDVVDGVFFVVPDLVVNRFDLPPVRHQQSTLGDRGAGFATFV